MEDTINHQLEDEPVDSEIFGLIFTSVCEEGPFALPEEVAREMFDRIRLPDDPVDMAQKIATVFTTRYPGAHIDCWCDEDGRICFGRIEGYPTSSHNALKRDGISSVGHPAPGPVSTNVPSKPLLDTLIPGNGPQRLENGDLLVDINGARPPAKKEGVDG